MRFGLLQLNPTVGFIEFNLKKLEKFVQDYANRVDLFITPELYLTGYPPRDLLSQDFILKKEAEALEQIATLSEKHKVGILVGHTEQRRPGSSGPSLYNCASLYEGGKLIGRIRKQRIPTYNIFDEGRFFENWHEGPQPPLEFRGKKLGIAICEDNWTSILAHGIRDVRQHSKESDPFLKLASQSDVLINLSASPYNIGKRKAREDLFQSLAIRHQKPLVYVNCTAAQDDICFDGASFCVDQSGEISSQATPFEESILVSELKNQKFISAQNKQYPVHEWKELSLALISGIRDYVHKTGFQKVVLGLSGGIDSALCAVLATKALGPENVLGVSLPSKITSSLSKDDAKILAKNLGIELREIPIQNAVNEHKSLLNLPESSLAYENLQSRNRGILLMTISNAENRLLLSTGNKSEFAMGYSTLYGDMCGALCPIGDLYKTEVYGLAHFLNTEEKKPLIPIDTLLRPPTAELAPDQKDTDSLPPYEVLDGVLEDLIENCGNTRRKEESWSKFLGQHGPVSALRKRFHRQEFKRNQAATILRVHPRAFGSGWRMPIVKDFT